MGRKPKNWKEDDEEEEESEEEDEDEEDDVEEKEEEAKENSKKESDKVEITQVITQTEPAFKLPNGKIIDLNAYLVWIGNNLVEIRKAVA